MRRYWQLSFSAGATLVLFLSTREVQAQANDAAAAQALFDDGKRLMGARQYAAACPKFAESQRLDPGIGTMLWLADCHAKNGRSASAWAVFNEAEALASKTSDPRVAIAREEAQKLEPKLSKLVIDVPEPANVTGLDVKRDGVTLGKPLWGTAMPMDPGVHRITVSAPERETWVTDVTVPPEGGSANVRIPILERKTETASRLQQAEKVAVPDPARGRTQRIGGIVLVGAGIAGAVGAGYFGLKTRSKNDESKPYCNVNDCDATGYQLRKDALAAATTSNVAFACAGAALVGGIALYLSAPKPTRTTLSAAAIAGGGGMVLAGSFR